MWLYYCLIIYMLISAIFLSVIIKKKRFAFIYIVFTVGLFAFLSMFRSIDVGNDTVVYANLFYNLLSVSDLSVYTGRYEVGYLYLNKILSLISNNHQILFIVTSLYIYFVVGRFIYKYSNMAWLSVFLFFTLRYFDLSMSGIRPMLAIATILLSYDFIIKKKPIKFLICVIIASSLHTTAIVFFAAYPLSKYKPNKNLVFVITIASLIVFLLFERVLNLLIWLFPRYYYYMNGPYLGGEVRLGVILGLLVILLILVACEIFYKRFLSNQKMKMIESNNTISLKSNEDETQSVFLLVACAIMFIALQANIFERFKDIFGFFSIIYLPNSICKISDRWTKALVTICTVVLFFAYLTIIQVFKSEWQSTYPYTFLGIRM